MNLYCIKHGEMVKAEKARLCPIGHMTDIGVNLGDGLIIEEPDYCCFDWGFAFSPPPSFNPYDMSSYEWMLWVAESQPSDEEILLSDINALSLRADCESYDGNQKT